MKGRMAWGWAARQRQASAGALMGDVPILVAVQSARTSAPLNRLVAGHAPFRWLRRQCAGREYAGLIIGFIQGALAAYWFGPIYKGHSRV